jgi:hypothetical protein
MFTKFLERTEDSEVINNIKDEMKNMFYKNRKHVIKDVKKLKTITNNIIDNNDKMSLEDIQSIEKKPTKKKVIKAK